MTKDQKLHPGTCTCAADQIEAMASVGIRQEREIDRLRAALEHYGRHEHPNCYDLTLKEDGSFGPRNGCLCGFDAAKGEGSPDETPQPASKQIAFESIVRNLRAAGERETSSQGRLYWLAADQLESFAKALNKIARRSYEEVL